MRKITGSKDRRKKEHKVWKSIIFVADHNPRGPTIKTVIKNSIVRRLIQK